MKRAVWTCLLVVACHRNQQAEGPVERAGKQLDRAADKTGQALEKAADKTGAAAKKAAHATGEALEKAGRKLKGDEPAATQQRPNEPTPIEAKPAAPAQLLPRTLADGDSSRVRDGHWRRCAMAATKGDGHRVGRR